MMRPVVLAIILAITLSACQAAPEPEYIEVTREVTVPVTVQVTRLVQEVVQATATPTPLSVGIQESVIYTGRGDALVDLEGGPVPALLHISGNAEGGHFRVAAYNDDNLQYSIPLASTDEPYEGIQPINFYSFAGDIVRLKVEAEREWAIELQPLNAARKLSVPGMIRGDGDDVILLEGEKPDVGRIRGNLAGALFAVTAHNANDPNWYGPVPLVFTFDPYDDEILIPRSATFLQIEAVGPWSIELRGK